MKRDRLPGHRPAKAGAPSGLRDCHFLCQIHVLDGVQQLDAFGHWALKRLASGDQTGSAAAFVDDGGADGISHIA